MNCIYLGSHMCVHAPKCNQMRVSLSWTCGYTLSSGACVHNASISKLTTALDFFPYNKRMWKSPLTPDPCACWVQLEKTRWSREFSLSSSTEVVPISKGRQIQVPASRKYLSPLPLYSRSFHCDEGRLHRSQNEKGKVVVQKKPPCSSKLPQGVIKEFLLKIEKYAPFDVWILFSRDFRPIAMLNKSPFQTHLKGNKFWTTSSLFLENICQEAKKMNLE